MSVKMMLTTVACLLSLTAAAATTASSTSCASHCLAFAHSTHRFGEHVKINNATYHDVHTYSLTNPNNPSMKVNNALRFCQITASMAYGPQGNNTLNFDVWLPDVQDYSRRFLALGNGGMAGTIDTFSMLTDLNLNMGFAIAAGDSGHLASANNNGEGEPGVYLPYLHNKAETKAWIHESISMFTPVAKEIVAKYYQGSAKAPKQSYYSGCSTGGAQGFALAQLHPHLFDGIFAGSPGFWYSHLALSFLWNAQHTNTSTTNLSQQNLTFITDAVLAACDGLDGVKDGVLENPLLCKFDINLLACKTPDEPRSKCLAGTQIDSAKSIYEGPKRSDNGAQVYPGFSFGSEIEWALQEGPLADAFSIPILQNLVYDNLNYSASNFNWASDVDVVDRKAGTFIDETSANISAFEKHGGKLLVSQGWADPLNAALLPIQYLDEVKKIFGDKTDTFLRLFKGRGGGHCGAATTSYQNVPANYHTLQSLVSWVERGESPKAILSSDPPDGSNTTRKLCPWPQTAHLVGPDAADWQDYTCS